MNLLIIGATGRTGKHVVAQAAKRGHKVTALVRNASADPDSPEVKRITGDPRNVEDLSRALHGQDAVISCLGQRDSGDKTLLRDSASSLVAAMQKTQETNASRLLVLSQGLLSDRGGLLIPVLRLILARHVADSKAMEQVITTSKLDWTIVRPPRLLDGGTADGYSSAIGRQPDGGMTMQRTDLAAFLLDAIERSEFQRAIVGVGPAPKAV